MREILFKAKLTDTKEWVEGYPFPPEPGGKLNRMIIFEDIPGGSTMSVVEIDPETLCQFTGLEDKNGVKIFEGDKMSYHYSDMGEEFDCNGTVVYMGSSFYIEEYDFKMLEEIDSTYLENASVIGNIHDEATP